MRRLLAATLLSLTFVAHPARVLGQSQPATPPPTRGDPQPVRPGDLVRLRIWREDDLSGEFMVDATGVVVFPRLGPYNVIDETGEHLAQRLAEAYRRYLINPSIEITVLRRINIVGAVAKPNVYNVDPTVTIADALAMAGGVTTVGNRNAIQLLRDGQPILSGITERTRIGDTVLESGDQIYVPEMNVIKRNTTALYTTFISAAVTIGITLLLR